MNAVSTLTNAIPLLVLTLIGGWLLKDRFDRIETRLDAIDTKIDGRPTRDELNGLVQRVERIETRMDSQFDSLRSDITQIALAVGAKTRPQTG